LSTTIIERLEALERTITARPPELIFVWTQSLADRFEPMLPKGRNYRLGALPWLAISASSLCRLLDVPFR
jgi:hypothetical protein